ncbi:hypothetical protein OXI21_08095 [Ignatzschineria sp. RMDPL8A]|uniref:CDI toxin immunity protein n=1 Tax=Ignatzschineria sp. RMDPL8A TaxID=2999236 RepID=UPI0024467078|nr:hypothetical protein [Ignatzschineria sp. RMDPL8A]MDG9730371.1 hypothetical protein [Ignatzschineria sp. RMDPL8A]
MKTLFDECIEALALECKIKIFDEQTSRNIVNMFEDLYPISKWNYVEWSKVKVKKKIELYNYSFNDVYEFLKDNALSRDSEIYIIWDDVQIPVVKSTLISILNNFDDVECVAPNIWLLSADKMYLIEFHHDGDRGWTIGLTSSIRK